MPVTRRGVLAGAVAGAALGPDLVAAAPSSRVGGVQIGVQTYSFHEIPNDGANHVAEIIRDMRACGLTSCELFAQQIAPGVLTGQRPSPADCPDPMHGCPPGRGGAIRNPFRWVFATYQGEALIAARARQKAWNETTSPSFFADVGRRFKNAGIDVCSYNVMLPADVSDREIDAFFEATRALGARALTVSTRYATMRRLAPFADKHRIVLAIHGHGVTWDPEEFSVASTFERAFALSPYVKANLDIGHFAATGEDPVAFIQARHDRIFNLHLKDRRRNGPTRSEEDGLSLPWGQGQTPIAEVLRLIQRRGYDIPAFIEYEHAGAEDPVTEVRKAYDYCRRVLA